MNKAKVCFSRQMFFVWVIVCVICAHVIVPRPDSFKTEGFWEIRIGWLSVRVQRGTSKHLSSQMSLLVGLDSETWLQQMHRPLKRCFRAKWGLSELGMLTNVWGIFLKALTVYSKKDSQKEHRKKTLRQCLSTAWGVLMFALKNKSLCACIRLLHTYTWRSNTYATASCFFVVLSLHSTVSAWFHFISLHHSAISQPRCNVNVGKLLSVCGWWHDYSLSLVLQIKALVSTLKTFELSALCNSQSAFNPLYKVSFLLKMTDRRWELQQKRKQLGTGVLQKPYILNLTIFIYASFHTVSSISDTAYSKLAELKADNEPAGGPVKLFRF